MKSTLTPQVPSHDWLLLFDRTRCTLLATWSLSRITDTCQQRKVVSVGWASCSFQSYSQALLKFTYNCWGRKYKVDFWVQKRSELPAITCLKHRFFPSTLVSRCHILKRWHPLNTDMLHAMSFSICLYLKYTSTFTPPHLDLTILLPQIKLSRF